MNTRAACTLRVVIAFFLLLLPAAMGLGGEASGKLSLKSGDVVVFTGGEDIVASQQNAYLELLLWLSFPSEIVRYRNMGWEGDTVFEQRRDLNFGAWSNQLQRVGAMVVFAQFGQSESLQGAAMLPAFIAGYERLLDKFAAPGRRLVLLSPTPFEKAPSPLPDLSEQNRDAQRCVEAIRELAARRGCLFVDLFHPLQKTAVRKSVLTRDGVHLSAHGHWLVAQETIRQLGLKISGAKVTMDAEKGTVSPAHFEQLRQCIIEKNQLWFDHWRPMNWAFLHGDRTEQPSSRDHRNPKVRWFPQEMEKFLPLIEAKEREAGEWASGRRR